MCVSWIRDLVCKSIFRGNFNNIEIGTIHLCNTCYSIMSGKMSILVINGISQGIAEGFLLPKIHFWKIYYEIDRAFTLLVLQVIWYSRHTESKDMIYSISYRRKKELSLMNNYVSLVWEWQSVIDVPLWEHYATC